MDKREILQKALENINHPLSEITRRTTYRGHSPGVKPTTGIKLNLPKTSTMAAKMERVLADKSPEGRKRMKQMNNLVIGREEDGDKISLEFKTTASRERFRKMMNELSENVQLDESVKIMFKGFDMEQRVFTAKLKKFGFDKEYRKMMQNFMKHASAGDGFYFIDGGRQLGFQVHPVSDMMMGPKIKKLGDKQDLGGGKTATLIAIKEDVQVNEMSPFNVMGGKKTATPRKMGRDLENRLKMTKPSEYTFSAPASGGGTFAVIPVDMKRPSMLSQAGVMMATFDKRGKVLAYYGTHMDTDAAKKFAKKEGLIESVQLDEGSEIEFKFKNPMKAGAFMRRIMRDQLASEVDRYDGERSPEEIVQVIMHPNDYERYDIERLAKRYQGELREDLQIDENVQNQVKRMDRRAKEKLAQQLNDLDLSGYGDYEARIDNVHKFKPSDLKMAMEMMSESFSMSLEERAMTYVIDRSTKKVVHGPTDTGDAKLYVKKQIQPRKFMIRQIRGAAKKVGDTV